VGESGDQSLIQIMTSTPLPDGGPAFPPDHQTVDYARDDPRLYQGMSLLDWFAGQALVGMASIPDKPYNMETTSHCAYRYADAMLAEKARRAMAKVRHEMALKEGGPFPNR
jgi:hypothetical protein